MKTAIIDALETAAAVHNIEVGEIQMNGYISALSGYTADEAVPAITKVSNSMRFFPKPYDIIHEIEAARNEKWRKRYDHDPDLSPTDKALGQDLAPLFAKFLAGKTTLAEWVGQMEYFADKHGVGQQMRDKIRENRLYEKCEETR